jgi:DNA-directed RNA polymerase specialized sigma24 family protein
MAAPSATMNEVVKRAQRGESAALEELITTIQPKIYGLALRMLWHPEDAKDATQEILLRIVTHPATFRGNSSFLTWAYRVAANHLLTWRKSRAGALGFTFENFGKDLQEALEDKSPRPEDIVFFQEIPVGCTLGCFCVWIVRTASPTFWVRYWRWTAATHRRS